MAKLIYSLKGVRGRDIDLYDTKIVITTNKTVGSFLSGNITDGKKTIFMCDIVGVQLKKSGLLIGYLQFETPSMQMDNQKDNMFSENTFTYEAGKNGITNELMENVYSYVVDRIEEIKYNTTVIRVEAKPNKHTSPQTIQSVINVDQSPKNSETIAENTFTSPQKITVSRVDMHCPKCKEDLSFMGWSESDLKEKQICPMCGVEIEFADN